MESPMHCAGCGYSIGVELGAADACPECGGAVAESHRQWDRIGGEHLAVRRLVLACVRLLPLWCYSLFITLAVTTIYFHLQAISPWMTLLSGVLVPGSIACLLEVIEFHRVMARPPMIAPRPLRIGIATICSLPWLAASACTLMTLLMPQVLGRLVESIGFGGFATLTYFALSAIYIPAPLALATLALAAPRAMPHWRSRSRLLRLGTWLVLAVLAAQCVPMIFLAIIDSPAELRRTSPALVAGMQFVMQAAPYPSMVLSVAIAILIVPLLRQAVSLGAGDPSIPRAGNGSEILRAARRSSVRRAARRVSIQRAAWGGALFAVAMWVGVAASGDFSSGRTKEGLLDAMIQVVSGSYRMSNLAMISIILGTGFAFSVCSLLPLVAMRGIRPNR